MTERQAAYNAGETEPIKPCPFCGEDDDSELQILAKFAPYSVMCMSCGSTGPATSTGSTISDIKRNAILLWNTAANALEAAKHECDNLREACLDYSLIQASLVKQRDEVIAERDEAKRIAALRLTDCETMATEAEKYKAERVRLGEIIAQTQAERDHEIERRVELEAKRDALQERCNVYTEQMQTYGRINEYCAKLEGDLYTASWQRDELAEKLDEARAWARKLWREKATLSEPRGKRQYGYRGNVTK